MTWLIKLVIGWGVPREMAKIVSFVLIGMLILVLLGVGKCAYDRSVIDEHEAKIEAETAREDRKADQNAADQRLEDQERRAQEQRELKEAVENAPDDPAVDDAVERRLAFHRCLGLQQRARAAGLEPPACV